MFEASQTNNEENLATEKTLDSEPTVAAPTEAVEPVVKIKEPSPVPEKEPTHEKEVQKAPAEEKREEKIADVEMMDVAPVEEKIEQAEVKSEKMPEKTDQKESKPNMQPQPVNGDISKVMNFKINHTWLVFYVFFYEFEKYSLFLGRARNKETRK